MGLTTIPPLFRESLGVGAHSTTEEQLEHSVNSEDALASSLEEDRVPLPKKGVPWDKNTTKGDVTEAEPVEKHVTDLKKMRGSQDRTAPYAASKPSGGALQARPRA